LSLRSYLIKRFAYTIVLVFFVIIVNWLIFTAMPGLNSSLYAVLANPKRVNDQQYLQLVHQFGLDKPYWVRFVDYVQNMLTFHFGFSYTTGNDVTTEMIQSGRLYNTLALIGVSTVLTIVIGTLLGIVAAHKRGSSLDSFWVTSSLTTSSLPTFWMGTLFILFFAITFRWLPSGGTNPASWNQGPAYVPSLLAQIPVRLEYLFLPALTLTLFSYGTFVLLTRATMTEALSEDYIMTARAKGLPERIVLMRHAFKNASLPIITATALTFGGILGGAIITETVFNWWGLGLWLFDSVVNNDYPVMQALFYLIALSTIGANLVADIIYGIVDPRIRYE
jgi:peptide/nickel transport system permease protein